MRCKERQTRSEIERERGRVLKCYLVYNVSIVVVIVVVVVIVRLIPAIVVRVVVVCLL